MEEGFCRRFGDELLEERGQKSGHARVGGRVTTGRTQDVLIDRRCPLGHGSRGWRKCGDQAGAGPGLRVTEVNEQPGWLEGPGPKDQGAGGLQGREMGIPIPLGKARGTGQGGRGQSSFREGRRRLAPWRRGLPCDDFSPGPLGVFTALRRLLQPCHSHPCVLSHSGVPDSGSQGLEPARLLCPWGFSRQEYWSRLLPFPPPGDLPDPGTEPLFAASPALQAGSLPLRNWPPSHDSCFYCPSRGFLCVRRICLGGGSAVSLVSSLIGHGWRVRCFSGLLSHWSWARPTIPRAAVAVVMPAWPLGGQGCSVSISLKGALPVFLKTAASGVRCFFMIY